MEHIGKRNRACVQQKADLGHLAAHPALGQRGHMADAHRGLARAAGHEFQRLGRVNRRGGVGAGDDCRHAPRRRRKPG